MDAAPASPELNSRRGLHGTEWGVALLIVIAIVGLHLVNLRHAGGLWRDEVVTYHVATMPSISDLWNSVWYDSFPAGVHFTLRLWASVGGGTTDLGLRLFGVLVGLAILAVVWLDGRLLGSQIPFLSMVLIGFSPPVIRYADSIRGYGLGIVTILLALGLIWKVTERPTPLRVVLAAGVAILSVQTLYQNAALLTAISAAGGVVTVWRRAWRRTALVVGIWLTAVVSLVPYRSVVSKASEGRMLLPAGVSFNRLFLVLSQTLGSPLDLMLWVWIALLVSGIGIAAYLVASRPGLLDIGRRASVFCAVAIVSGTLGFMAFMKMLDLPSQPWHYVPLIAFSAVALQGIFAGSARTAIGRAAMVVVAVSLAGALAFPAWQGLQARLTNIDSIAAALHRYARPGDMILVYPWYSGATFQRYFHGETPWTTLPPQGRLHLQDKALCKQQMMTVDPNRPVRDRIIATLDAGGRVWLVGGLPFLRPGELPPPAPPAPSPVWGWNHDAYSLAWGMEVAHLIQTRALRLTRLPRLVDGPVQPYENLEVLLVEGLKRG
jgi:hypothetical protein